MDKLIIKGAREHNLKNIDLELPRDKLIVISGLSGSGKSSLAFDTIFAEGQRRYVESLSAYARQFLGRMDKPDVDYIEGLSPAISIEQKTTHRNPRSTVGTVTEIYDYYRLLYARIGIPHCPKCGRGSANRASTRYSIPSSPGPRARSCRSCARHSGAERRAQESARGRRQARLRARARRRRDAGTGGRVGDRVQAGKAEEAHIEIVVDRLKLSDEARKRLAESVETALEIAEGTVIALREPIGAAGNAGAGGRGPSGSGARRLYRGVLLAERRLSRVRNLPARDGAQALLLQRAAGSLSCMLRPGPKLEFDPDLVIPDGSPFLQRGRLHSLQPRRGLEPQPLRGPGQAFQVQPRNALP